MAKGVLFYFYEMSVKKRGVPEATYLFTIKNCLLQLPFHMQMSGDNQSAVTTVLHSHPNDMKCMVQISVYYITSPTLASFIHAVRRPRPTNRVCLPIHIGYEDLQSARQASNYTIQDCKG